MNIEQQKDVALAVYDRLSIIDPECILAGGAPRDWYMGNPCNDLDFYFASPASTATATKRQLDKLFTDVKQMSKPEKSDMYAYMPGLSRIWECKVNGIGVQLIQMNTAKDRWLAVDHMDVSICKIWMNRNGHIIPHKDFKLTMGSKIMFLREGYRWSNKHGKKMMERFSEEYTCGTREQAVNSIVNKQLELL